MKRKFFAMLMAVCMVLGLLPTTALAAPASRNSNFVYASALPNGKIQLEIRADDDETVIDRSDPTDSIQISRKDMKQYDNDHQVVYLRAIPDEDYGFAGWSGITGWNMGPNPICLSNLNRNMTHTPTAIFQPLVTVYFDAGMHGKLAAGESDTDTVVSNYWNDSVDFPELVVDGGYRFTGWLNSADNKIYTWADEVPASWDGATFTAQYEEVSYQIEKIDVTIGDRLAEAMPQLKKSDILHAEYGDQYILLSGYNGHFTTPWIADYWHSIPDNLTNAVDTVAEAQAFFGGFTAIKTFPFWSTWKGWLDGGKIVDVRVDGTTLYLTLDEPAPAVQTIQVSMNLAEGCWADSSLKDFTLSSETPDAVQQIPAVQAPEGKEFVGWKLAGADDPMDDLVFSFNGLKDLVSEWNGNEASLAFEAVYEEIPAVTFTYQAGEHGWINGVCTETLDRDENGKASPKEVPFAWGDDGYEFAGWQIGEASEAPLVSSEELAERSFAEDTTFTAAFKEIPSVRYLFNIMCDGKAVDFTTLQCPEGTVFETEEELRQAVVVQDPFYYGGKTYHFTGFEQDGTNVYLYYAPEVKNVTYTFYVVSGDNYLDFTLIPCPEGTVFKTEEQLRQAVVVQDPFYSQDGHSYRYTGFEQYGTIVYLYYEAI